MQGYNARNVICSCIYSAYILKPNLSGRNYISITLIVMNENVSGIQSDKSAFKFLCRASSSPKTLIVFKRDPKRRQTGHPVPGSDGHRFENLTNYSLKTSASWFFKVYMSRATNKTPS